MNSAIGGRGQWTLSSPLDELELALKHYACAARVPLRLSQRRTEKPRRRVEMVDFPGTPPRRRPKGLRTMYDDESDDDDDPDVS